MPTRAHRRVTPWNDLRIPSLAALGLVLLASACGEEAATTEPGQSPGENVSAPLAAAPPVLPGDDPAPTEVVVSWRSAGRGRAVAANQSLVAELANTTAEAKTGELVLVASGLDGQLVERPLGPFAIASGQRQEVRVRVRELPIQSESATAFAAIVAELSRPEGKVRVSTEPLYYRFRGGYDEAVLASAAEVGLGATGGLTKTHPEELEGRLLGTDGSWREVRGGAAGPAATGPLGVSGAGAAAKVGATALHFGRADVSPPPPTGPIAGAAKATGETATASAEATTPAALVTSVNTLCTTWRVQYTDAGFGEDYFATSSWQDVPASMARAWVTYDNGAVIWSGWLDREGCTPALGLSGLNFRLYQATASMTYGSITFNAYYNNDGQDYYTYVYTPFQALLSGRLVFHPSSNSDAIQTAAVAGQILQLQAGGWDLGIVGGTYTIKSNVDCPGGGGSSCTVGSTVYISPALIGSTPRHHWKYNIAHEVGHAIRNASMGSQAWTYADNSTEPHCACDHYSVGSRSHCLQSRENSGAAQDEGIAHAIATRAFNYWTQPNGVFVYYKPFLEANNAVRQPPVDRNAYSPVRWMANHCPAAARGVEWDWLTFAFNVGSTYAPNGTPFGQLFGIYRLACSGSANTKCTGQNIEWSTLLSHAQEYYGSASDLRYIRFRDTGNSYGVAY